MEEPVRLCGLYKRKGKKGPYLWGKLHFGEYEGCELVISPNPRKQRDSDVDFFCYINPSREKKPQDSFEFFDEE